MWKSKEFSCATSIFRGGSYFELPLATSINLLIFRDDLKAQQPLKIGLLEMVVFSTTYKN
jgi:hypothetical protein